MRVIIWAPNHKPDWYAACRAYCEKHFPGARIHVSNPDAYQPGQHARADVVLVPERYGDVISAYADQGATVIWEPAETITEQPSTPAERPEPQESAPWYQEIDERPKRRGRRR